MTRFVFLLAAFSATACRPEAPKLFREKPFTCATLAETANYYIDRGEAASVRELQSLILDWNKDFTEGFSRNERIGWVCRIVFLPRDKNEALCAPAFGDHQGLPRNSMPSARWPLYPVAVSGSTYFVLSEGYSLKGAPEDAKDYLKYCQTTGKFRTERISTPSKVQALRDLEQLRQSESWKAIRWKDSGPGFSYSLNEDAIWNFIKAQAEHVPVR